MLVVEKGVLGKKTVKVSDEELAAGIADGSIVKVSGNVYKRVYQTKIVESDLDAEGSGKPRPEAPKKPPEPAKESDGEASGTPAPAKSESAPAVPKSEESAPTPTPAPKPAEAPKTTTPKSTSSTTSTPSPKKS